MDFDFDLWNDTGTCYGAVVMDTVETLSDEYKSNIIYMMLSPVLLVTATIGSVLTIVVLSSKHLGPFPSAPYLSSLAAVDVLFLYYEIIPIWLQICYGIKLKELSDFTCKMQHYVGYTLRHISAWLVVAVMIDRLVCVVKPLKSNRIRRKHRIITTIVIHIVFITLHAPSLFYYEIERFNRSHRNEHVDVRWCGSAPNTQYTAILSIIANPKLLDIPLYSILPFFILVSCNIIIVIFLRKSLNAINKMVEPIPRKNESSNRMTRMALLLSTIFLVTTTPFAVLTGLEDIAAVMENRFALPESYETNKKTINQAIKLIMYANHSVNFILYCFTGPRFRVALKKIFQRERNSKTRSNTENELS